MECSLNNDLEVVYDWFRANKLTLNISKSTCLIFSPTKTTYNKLKVCIGNQEIPINSSTKFLGTWLDNELCWHTHLSSLQTKLNQGLGLLCRAKNSLSNTGLKSIYYAHFYRHLTYSIVIWGNMIQKSMLDKLQRIQNKCMKIIGPNRSLEVGYKQHKILHISDIIELENNKLGYKIANILLPTNLLRCLETSYDSKTLKRQHGYMTRNKKELNIPILRKESFLV